MLKRLVCCFVFISTQSYSIEESLERTPKRTKYTYSTKFKEEPLYKLAIIKNASNYPKILPNEETTNFSVNFIGFSCEQPAVASTQTPSWMNYAFGQPSLQQSLLLLYNKLVELNNEESTP